MTTGDDDADRPFIRSKWGTNRYVYNPHSPVGRALIVGSLLLVVGGVYLIRHPDLLSSSDGWEGSELRSAVTDATAELSRESEFGPGGTAFEDVLEAAIARHGGGSKAAPTVSLASEPADSGLIDGGLEQADYTVTADGTDASFCLDVTAAKRKSARGYEFVSIGIDDDACPTSR
ncbi:MULTISPECIES: hypothetical protein [Streptomyces]|uniref:Uncharacterized protein n=1 Tax=Streptomyces lienomycini TaxID=284035 RepID=A0ABV9WZR1_9ACTN|nr:MULTISPECIES: hypothetical protein [Streptomyces]